MLRDSPGRFWLVLIATAIGIPELITLSFFYTKLSSTPNFPIMKQYCSTFLFIFLILFFIPRVHAQDTFDFVIETTAEQTEYAFVADDAVGLEVDWGDGSGVEMFNGSVVPTHDYGEAGEWTLSV
mgnify:CR=1 FL=1